MVDKVLDIQFYFHHHFKHSLHNIITPQALTCATSLILTFPSSFHLFLLSFHLLLDWPSSFRFFHIML